MKRVLLIDDEHKLRTLLARIIGLEGEGYEVTEVDSLKPALKQLNKTDYDVVLCDVKLPDGDGVSFIPQIKAVQPFAEVILLTAYGNIPDGVKAIKNGAFDYITKGDDNHRIIPLLNKAYDKASLAKRVHQLELKIEKKYSFESIIGKSKAVLQAVSLGKKVAPMDTTVLLLGETGTGKEVFAQAIHYESNRKNKPFVAINCSAFGREILESELFGHKEGSFTGATKDKKGLFEEANTGTIFLDEIGEMSVDLQAKLLRVLESGEFLKVGDTKPTRVDVRVLAATNRNLEEEIAKEHFRSDLYYRLSVFTITLPPLRERQEDIALLAKYYMQIYALKANLSTMTCTPDYLAALKNYSWKGNIRELKNIIERSVIVSDGNVLDMTCLPDEFNRIDRQLHQQSPFSMALAEQAHIQNVLLHTHGNKAEAARLMGIGIATLYRKIDEYKISI
ncbi:sigma-54-dependent transcriptional regulator [Sphingobacterium spiritivorum]|uniref:Sigma-54 interaction domain protein n=1 Tax=Sphingobacterium spiritivorum ATCC 33861 TaxID=525373 RepID=D7VKM3_SPHSI|nr:sigma-54 dependent transcriptional regulator [Sphingobacterium spiritivorum]EFK58825.1 Sigma-54 interaction domain protein [Sphingobacterium spiritivorum ATCC 33861]QQT34296.1 sigma-54-dependent Fis family transcriptional regulator [Sphingobacterium spiritivorum]WQD35138.1 sigma-54 dependent transcriptional regulator [Sphingobacterium spiritivorum]SUI99459.1 Transcriptional regulatory protein ZraR [Sphingobacterium spiritivorum]